VFIHRTQWPSRAISGPSMAIPGPSQGQSIWQSVAISRNQSQSVAISGHLAISRNQSQSVAICGHPRPSNGGPMSNPSGRSRWHRDRDHHLARTCCTRAVSRWGNLSILTPSGRPRTSRWVSSPRPSGSAATSSRSASRACSRPACMQWSMSAYHIRQPRANAHQRQSSECSSEAIKRMLIRGNQANAHQRKTSSAPTCHSSTSCGRWRTKSSAARKSPCEDSSMRRSASA